jgi:hypothetical protein
MALILPILAKIPLKTMDNSLVGPQGEAPAASAASTPQSHRGRPNAPRRERVTSRVNVQQELNSYLSTTGMQAISNELQGLTQSVQHMIETMIVADRIPPFSDILSNMTNVQHLRESAVASNNTAQIDQCDRWLSILHHQMEALDASSQFALRQLRHNDKDENDENDERRSS